MTSSTPSPASPSSSSGSRDGSVLGTYTSPKAFGNVIYSTSGMTNGSTYTVSVDGTSTEATAGQGGMGMGGQPPAGGPEQGGQPPADERGIGQDTDPHRHVVAFFGTSLVETRQVFRVVAEIGIHLEHIFVVVFERPFEARDVGDDGKSCTVFIKELADRDRQVDTKDTCKSVNDIGNQG